MMTEKRAIAVAIALMPILIASAARADVLDQINAYLTGTPAPSAPIAYGTGNGLTPRQSNILRRRELALPQSYPAMIAKFGYPDQRDTRADYYRMDDGRTVAVVYQGRSAIALEGL
ncbi:MAG: hypothetical protein RLZZ511_1034 [Cyanobacteriota bacterium]|jgi:hypothetical protein